jgi:hypothetical protein
MLQETEDGCPVRLPDRAETLRLAKGESTADVDPLDVASGSGENLVRLELPIINGGGVKCYLWTYIDLLVVETDIGTGELAAIASLSGV